LSGDQIETNEIGGIFSTYRAEERRIQVLVGKPERKRPLVRPRYRWEDNIKMDLQVMGSGSMDWMDLTQDRDR